MKTVLRVLLLCLISNTITAQNPDDFVHADGRDLVVGPNDEKFCIRGINLNTFWFDSNNNLIQSCCAQNQYQHISDMNFNTIRLHLAYGFFEDDSNPFNYLPSGWSWLDQQIQWAQQHDVKLILAMMDPQGGNQITGNFDLYFDAQLQQRLKALWAEIAQRYVNDTTIIAYDLVNEPVMPNTTTHWKNLAPQLVDTIRVHDNNHLINVQKVHSVWSNWTGSIDPDSTQFLINDPNILYDFHFYEPFEYTHQLTPWTGLGDGGEYPSTEYQTTSDMVYKDGTFSDPNVPSGSTPWSVYNGAVYNVTDPSILIGFPALNYNLSTGQVFFDSIIVREYDAGMNFIGNIIEWDITMADNVPSNWQNWGSGTLSFVNNNGVVDDTSALMQNGNGGVNLRWLQFFVQPGNSYQVVAWMEGQNLAASDNARMSLAFEGSYNGCTLNQRDSSYLACEIDIWSDFMAQNNVPMTVGEWGPARDAYLNPGKGGVDYAHDMMELLINRNLNYCFFSHGFLTADYQGQPDTLYAAVDFLTTYLDTVTRCGNVFTSVNGEIAKGNGIELYPNPATEQVQINITVQDNGPIAIELYNTHGQLVRRLARKAMTGHNEVTMDISGVGGGLYMVHFKTRRGIITKKLIVTN